MTAGNGWLNFFVVLFAATGSLSYGYSAGIISTTLGQPTFLSYMKLDKLSNASSLISAMIVGFQAGGLVGALCAPYFADRWGRKRIIFISGTGIVITSALTAGAVNVAMFLVFRTLCGVFIGGVLCSVPLFQSEICPAAIRGKLMACHGFRHTVLTKISQMLASGYFLSSWMSFAFYYLPNTNLSWRLPLAFQIIFPLTLICGLPWLPESPRWLIVEAGREDEARRILDQLHKNPNAEDPYEISRQEFKLIIEQNELEKTLDTSYGAILRVPSYRKRAFLCALTMFLYPSTGTLCITNYLPSLLAKMHFGPSAQLALAGGYITYAPFGNIVAANLLDHKFIGRKGLLKSGLVGCAIALIGETVSINKGINSTIGQRFAVFFLFLHLCVFATCLDAPSFVYSAEIWPNHLRAKGFSIGVGSLFLGAIIWLGAAGEAFKVMNEFFYCIFTGICVFGFVVIHFFWPETANVPLESMGLLFGDQVAEDFITDKPTIDHVENVPTLSAGGSAHSK
ncbi:general substrate transporter [Meredithblackwellia eburnea MCA 4105]